MFAGFLILLCAVNLAGCATSAPNAGAGYELLTPAPATAARIVAEDRPFAEQVAAHNRKCRQDRACRR